MNLRQRLNHNEITLGAVEYTQNLKVSPTWRKVIWAVLLFLSLSHWSYHQWNVNSEHSARISSSRVAINIQPWCTPFPIWSQSFIPCLVLTVASWLVYIFLTRQVRWSGISIPLKIFQFVVIHKMKGFGIVNKTEIDIFLKNIYCFFDDSLDDGNLISGSSAFFLIQLEHLEVHSSCTVEAWLGEFWALLY